jgi:hypothetical protein
MGRGATSVLFDLDEQTISFIELMELHFIKLFRDEGVWLPTICRAAKTAAQQFSTPHPFAVHRLDTDGQAIFATLIKSEKRSKLIEDLERSQYIFATVVRPFFKKLGNCLAEWRGGPPRACHVGERD